MHVLIKHYKIIFCLLFVIFHNSVFGKHIVGGEITYRCLGKAPDDTSRIYEFTMIIYRDCAATDAAQYDDPATIGLYRGNGSRYTWVMSPANVSLLQREFISPPDDPCLTIPPGLCVERGVYRFTLILPVITENYYLSYTRCCRNETIINIHAKTVGATFAVEITPLAQQLMNSSPTFNNFPPTVICVNNPISFDHGAKDADGDSLVYEFCTPIAGGGPNGSNGMGSPTDCNGVTPDPRNCLPPFENVGFIQPTYSATYPMAGNPLVQIDQFTGLITGTPQIQGQFVMGVCVYEYRDGKLLSSIRRDFQFNVSTCISVANAMLDAELIGPGKTYRVKACGTEKKHLIKNLSTGNKISSYDWYLYLKNDTVNIKEKDINYTFPDTGVYNATMILNQGTQCADTAYIKVYVFPYIKADFEYSYDTCIYGPVVFKDKSETGSGTMTDWRWNFDDGTFSANADDSHLYGTPGLKDVVHTVTDVNGCVDSITKTIPFYPIPPQILLAPDIEKGCAPQSVYFNNLSIPIDSTYDIQWNFGDGNKGTGVHPTHVYETPGTYDVDVSITSPVGCSTSAHFEDLITVRESPVADFTYSPARPSNFEPKVSFTDQSLRAVKWEWIIDQVYRTGIQHPVYTFPDTGVKTVTLIVEHIDGCRDSLTKIIDVEPRVTYYLPNAFTPNIDGTNDIFAGKGVYDGMKGFKLTIWDRWGGLVFETTDPNKGWNGRKNNEGELLPMGVYVYLVEYVNPRSKKESLKGFATLIK